ncbi:MAG TPA: hypothetical protein VL990_14150 [Acidobacteriaceae bacterium]|nr:hypothetical protein [Acidobacteriaceae bacterium]HUB19779.1 hypothetical protein [Acidobacteriaceae bacterium]
MVLAWMANAGVLWFLVSACVFMARQRRRKIEQQKTRDLAISPLAGLAMGAMFLGFQEILQPQVRHMIVEELKEERADDGAKEPLGGRLFHEQMRRIRRGEDVEQVTVKVDEQ